MGLTVAPRNFKSCFLLVEKHAQRSLSSTVTVQGGGQGCNHLRDSLLSVGWVENSRLGIWFIFLFVFMRTATLGVVDLLTLRSVP